MGPGGAPPRRAERARARLRRCATTGWSAAMTAAAAVRADRRAARGARRDLGRAGRHPPDEPDAAGRGRLGQDHRVAAGDAADGRRRLPVRAARADGSACRPTCPVDPRRARTAGDGGATRRRRERDPGRAADRVDVAAAEARGARRGRLRRGGHRHRHARAAAGRRRVPPTSAWSWSTSSTGSASSSETGCAPRRRDGHHPAPAGDDGDADPEHGGADDLRRPGDLDAAGAAARASADHHQHDLRQPRSRRGSSARGQRIVEEVARRAAGLRRRVAHRRGRQAHRQGKKNEEQGRRRSPWWSCSSSCSADRWPGCGSA